MVDAGDSSLYADSRPSPLTWSEGRQPFVLHSSDEPD